MRLKALLTITLIMMIFLLNVTTIAFSGALLAEETGYIQELDNPSANSDHTSYPVGLQGNSQFSNPKIQNGRTETQTPNIFGLGSFVKDLSSHKADEWSNIAYVDDDSAELVIGVNYAQPDSYTKVTDLIVENGGKLVNTVSIRDEVIALVADMPLDAVSSFVALMQASDVVRYVEPNMKFQTQFVPNDTSWSWQWGPQVIEADWAWNTTIGDPSILVAVIDTGVDYDHPDLASNYVPLGYDWVNVDVYPMDDNGHGTHCAGTIAAEINNGIGIAGLAQVQIMAEKGLDSGGWGTEDDLANAIIHAVDQGADILSNSWGSYSKSLLIYDAVKYAYDNGVLVVAAAGNDATRNKLYPAAHDEVIAVTATDQLDDPASFTNFGDWVEVAAPGVDIYSTVWDDSYTYMSGTSMATPHVSGTAALIWSQFPNMTRDWVRAQLRYSADDLGDPGFDDYYGYGRINARNAVEQAPPDHDLLIFDWERPQYVKVGELATFNTTVLNFGISDETSVEVQLLVNSSLIDSTSIAFLPGGTSTTVGLSWTPTVEGAYNVTSYVVPVLNETITQNNLITEIVTVIAPPPDANWILLATDPDEGVGTSLKAIYGQLYSDIIYFKVEHHRPWATINDINTGIFIDADQDPSTGLPDGYYPGQNTGIGADYVIVVGWEATEMWTWDPDAGFWDLDNPISLAYLDAPDGSNVFVVGVFLASVETAGTIDCAVTDTMSDWDWMPDTGYFTLFLIRYEHELTVFLEAPHHLQPGDSSLLNATVYNIGLNNETNVELQLLIDGTIVDNVTIPEMVNGTSHTIDHIWTPTVEATYNITAYAPPVPDENITANNAISVYINVQYLEVALFKNVDPWDYPANEEALSVYGIAYAVFTSSDFGLVDLSSFSKVIIASDQDQTFYNAMDAYRWWFEDYVSGGGILEIHAADQGWHGGGWVGTLPGGLQWVSYYSDYVTIVDPTHPVATTPNLITDAELDGWSASVHGYFGTYPADSRIVIIEDFTGYPAYLEFDYGAGVIVASSQTLEWAYGHGYSLILENSLLYSPIKYPHELAVTLEAPAFLEPGDSSLLNATVYNRGLSNETNVELSLLINGTIVDNVTIPELVNGTSHTIDHIWTPTVEATYNITAYAPPVPDENVTANNIMSKIVYVRYVDVALISDYSELLAITGILDSMGIGYDIYNDNSMYLYTEDLSLLLDYPTVIFYTNYRHITSNEYSALESYLSSGGNLLVTGFDSLVGDSLLADLVRSSSVGDNMGEPDLYVVDAAHPIMNGPYGSFPAGYHISGLYSDNDAVEADTARNAVTVAELADGYDKIIATDGLLGKVVYWNGVGPNDWTWNSDCEVMFKNTIVWLKSRRPIASLTHSPMDPYVGETVTFNASASYDPDGTIVSYIWNFGDGTSDVSNVTTHVYAAGGTHTVTLTVIDNEGLNSTATSEVTVLRTTIDIQVKVGSIHFRGEIAEFYVLFSSLGKPIDANISATLYYNGNPYENLSTSVEHVNLGLYRIPYTIPLNASTGTYALVVEASYLTLRGTALESFLLSSTLTGWNAQLISIEGGIATIETDVGLIQIDIANIQLEVTEIDGKIATIQTTLGTIEVKLDAINATLVNIEGKIATINSTIGVIQTDVDTINANITAINGSVATIQTTLGTLEGRITSIEESIATIETDIGTIKTILEGWTGGTTSTITTPLGDFQILVLTTSTLEGPIAFSDNVLTTTLSGSSGTAGTTNVVIPKQLLVGIESSIDKVTVTIDDEEVLFTYTEQPGVYVLQITYTHSIHVIKTYLAGLPPTPFQWAIFIAILIVVVIAAAGVAVYILKIRKPRIASDPISIRNLDF